MVTCFAVCSSFLAGGEGGGGVNSKLPLLPLPFSSAGLNSFPELWYGKLYSHKKKQINYPIKHCCGSVIIFRFRILIGIRIFRQFLNDSFRIRIRIWIRQKVIDLDPQHCHQQFLPPQKNYAN
jgi:hypothetical protein